MSIGFAGCCWLEDADEELALYSYEGENWNLPKEEARRLEAVRGAFSIRLDALEEPELSVGRAKLPGRCRKAVREKVVTHLPDLSAHLTDGGITVDALCGLDELERAQTGTVLPRVVRLLLYDIYGHYQKHGKLPERGAFIQ